MEKTRQELESDLFTAVSITTIAATRMNIAAGRFLEAKDAKQEAENNQRMISLKLDQAVKDAKPD